MNSSEAPGGILKTMRALRKPAKDLLSSLPVTHGTARLGWKDGTGWAASSLAGCDDAISVPAVPTCKRINRFTRFSLGSAIGRNVATNPVASDVAAGLGGSTEILRACSDYNARQVPDTKVTRAVKLRRINQSDKKNHVTTPK